MVTIINRCAIVGLIFLLISTASLISGCADTVHFRSFNKSDPAAGQPLYGYLNKPEGPGPFPAVVLLHGCAGLNQAHSHMADQLVKQGYVSLIVDSFGSRGFFNICENPRKLDPLNRAMDAYGALIHLQELPFVDSARIALIGWSHGGSSALSAVDRSNDYFFPDESNSRFKAAVTYYPGCNVAFRPNFFADVLLLIGDRDDWSLPNYCEMMIKYLPPESRPVDFVLYPGATHAFDNNLPSRNYLGYSLAYSPSATDDSIKRTLQFLKDRIK